MSACDNPASSETIRLDTAKNADTHLMEITAPGPLQSRLADGRACFWFVTTAGEPVSIIWPHGSVAQLDPLRVVSADGRTIAVTGDEGLSFTGSFLEDRSGCAGPDSETFVAGVVERAGDVP